jgi:hypothetical protein
MAAVQPGWVRRLATALRYRRSRRRWQAEFEASVAWLCCAYRLPPHKIGIPPWA